MAWTGSWQLAVEIKGRIHIRLNGTCKWIGCGGDTMNQGNSWVFSLSNWMNGAPLTQSRQRETQLWGGGLVREWVWAWPIRSCYFYLIRQMGKWKTAIEL